MDIGTLTGGIELEDQLSGVLTQIADRVKTFSSGLEGMLGKVAIGAGIVTTAVTAVAASITGLGVKGSTILGVEEAFDRLARQAGSTGEVMVGALSKGVRYTVDSMELMQATTRLLSSGVKLTSGDLELMATTAREMGKATGTDAADGLNTLSSAILTGNTRMLKRYGIQLDLTKAEKQFRASLGGTTAALSDAGKLEVTRLAILDGMRAKLDALGSSELTFKERIKQVVVSIGDWTDQLAKAVAVSPHIGRAWDAISNALREAFGGTSQGLLEWVIKWINRFADAVAEYGPPIVRTVADIRDWIVKIWETVTEAWSLVPDWFKNIAKDAALAGGAVFVVSKGFGSLGGTSLLDTVGTLATITSGLKDFSSVAITAVPKAIVQIKGLYDALSVYYLLGSFAGGGVIGGVAGVLTGIQAGFVAIASSTVGISALFVGIAAGIWQIVRAVQAFDDNWKKGGGTFWGFITLKDDDTFIRRWLGLSQAVDEAVKSAKKGSDIFLPKEEKPPEPPRSPDLFKDMTAEKIKDLLKSWGDAEKQAGIFEKAFSKLTAAQRDNYAIQQLLIPEIDKLLASHRAVTPEMLRLRDAAQATRLQLLEKDRAVLASQEVTQGQIDQMKQLGLTEADIAAQYSVSTEAITTYLAELQRADQIEKNLATFRHAALAQEQADHARREAAELAANRAIGESNEELNDLILRQTATTTRYQIQKIQEETAARIAAFSLSGATAQQIKEFNQLQEEQSKRRVAALMIDNDALLRNSRQTLEQIRDRAWNTYKAMEAAPERYSETTRREFKRIAQEASAAAEGTKTAWQKAYDTLGDVATILDNIPGTFSEIAAVAARAGQAIMENLSEGDVFGAIVAGGTAAASVITKLIGLSRSGRNAVKEFAASFDTLAEGTGFDELHEKLLRLGPAGEQLWISLTRGVPAGNADAAREAIKKVQAALDALDADIKEYNLTWSMLVDAQAGGTAAGSKLVDTFKRLTGAGYSADSIIKAMSEDLNEYIAASLTAGTKIPEALRPIIESLIRTGQLSEANVATMLGLADTFKFSLEEIEEAAEKYGLTIDDLGGKAAQMKFTSIAAEITRDWEILSGSADNVGLVMEKMAPKVQDIVTQALKFGRELPDSMKPMLERMLEAGLLTDDTGEKLKDLSQLKFTRPLAEAVDSLIAKLDELIEKISDGVGGALRGIGNIRVSPRIDIPEAEEASYYSRGGRVLAFTPRGTDTVPAMLTPGETVTPAGREELVGYVEVPLEVDGEKLGEAIVKVVKRA